MLGDILRGLILKVGIGPRLGLESASRIYREGMQKGLEECAQSISTQSFEKITLGVPMAYPGFVAAYVPPSQLLAENPFARLYPEFYGQTASRSTDLNTRAFVLFQEGEE